MSSAALGMLSLAPDAKKRAHAARRPLKHKLRYGPKLTKFAEILLSVQSERVTDSDTQQAQTKPRRALLVLPQDSRTESGGIL